MSRTIQVLLLILVLPALGLAGTNGILEGIVTDRNTGERLPGVNVTVVELQYGNVTDSDGRYQLQNVRVGSFDVRFSLVGYQSVTIRNVLIHPDLRSRLNVDLVSSDIHLDEIVVIQEKPLIQKDVTGTTFIVSGNELEALPIDVVSDIIRLKPGVTIEGNVRGGRSTEVLYLVDGLPIQDVISGGISATLPTSSVFGTSIYTGGFEPEYGNALSGVVNIITRTGTNKHRVLVRGDKDNLFGGKQNSKSQELELSATGPLLENRLYYTGAINGFFTDTRWWQDFRHFVESPVERTFSGLAKLDYSFSPTFRLGGQALVSRREWHDYEFNWRFNLNGLPAQQRTSYRIAVILSQSLSDDFFYTASLSRYSLNSRIGTGGRGDVPINDSYQYDFFLQYVIDGQRAWWSRTTQESYTARLDGTWKSGENHLVKFGAELNLYDLTSDLIKYEPRKTYFGKPLIDQPQLNFSSSYNYRPRSGAIYVQDKIDIPKDGILLSAGLRYDFMDPTAKRPNIEAIPVADTSFRFEVKEFVDASVKHQVSPRVGAAMQLTEHGYLFINLGWYFQFPLFDYLYTGLDRAAIARGLSAFTGNPDLEPERTRSYEVSLKYHLGENIVGAITYFRKETKNLVDTKTFIPGDSKLAGNFGFSEFVNTPFAEIRGLEVVLTRERGEWLTGEVSYSYMVAEGTSGTAQDGFYVAQFGLPPARRLFPLSWDQRHTLKTTTVLRIPGDFNITIVGEWHSGRPYTAYPTSTGFEQVVGGLFSQNNERMPRYLNLDIKAAKGFRFGWWDNATFTAYLDVRNLANQQNVRWVDSNGRIGGELGDPSGYYTGRRTTLGVKLEF